MVSIPDSCPVCKDTHFKMVEDQTFLILENFNIINEDGKTRFTGDGTQVKALMCEKCSFIMYFKDDTTGSIPASQLR